MCVVNKHCSDAMGLLLFDRHTLPSLLLIGSVRIIIDIVNIIIVVNIKPFLLLIELVMVIIVAIMIITNFSKIS